MAARDSLVTTLNSALAAAADPDRARAQQAYMKSTMPFFGITAPILQKICREAFNAYPCKDAAHWLQRIMAMWRQATHREQRHCAIYLLSDRQCENWLSTRYLPELEEIIVTGAWWDFVDPVAANQFGRLLSKEPNTMVPILRTWSQDLTIWKRRTAMLAQLKFKQQTDFALLTELIEPSMDEKEFFLRKAIGWALREYSKTDPDAVISYVNANADRMSGLSKREAFKVMLKRGQVTSVP